MPNNLFLDVDWLVAAPDVVSARLRLMAAAWGNNPTGSIHHIPGRMHRIANVTPQRWKKIEADVLREFIHCSDDRLYHPHLCAAAYDFWQRMRKREFNPRSIITPREWAAVRAEIFARDDYTCGYCGQRGGKLECDHVIPVSRGGANDHDNLITACFRCNRSKGAKTPEEWRAA